MMKKLSKIALLAAASAFMLAVFPACGDDEDDPSVEITGSNSVTLGETLELTATVSDFPEGDVAYAWSSSDESVATVVADSETPSKATVTPVAEGKATITVTATVGDTVAIAAIEVSVKAEGTVEAEGGAYEGWTWTVAGYATSASTTKLGSETSCGKITAGKNVKETSSGNGVDGTIGEGVSGYFQLSAGADGSVWFTAPAGTKKIIVCAKLDATTKQIVLRTNATSTTDYKDLGTVSGEASANYKDHVFTVDITEDTVVYAGTFATGVSANMKAIKVSE